MGTKQFSNYEDLLTFTRASGGHALRPVSYGTELLTNGTFDTDTTGWTASGSATLSVVSGELKVLNPSSANYGYAVQSITTIVGAVYQLDVDFNYIEANGLVRVGTTSGGDEILTQSFGSGDEGTHRFSFVATSTTTYIRVGLSVNTVDVEARFDNISVKEVTFDESDGTLTLFEHPTNIPRVEYDADGNRLGLLVEEARTNLVTYSEDFTDASWTPSGATFTGTDEAILTAGQFINTSVTPSTATQHVVSIDVKKTSTGFIRFGAFQTGVLTNNVSGWFDTSTGEWDTFSVNGTYTNALSFVRDIGDYWRISLSAVFPTNTQSIYVYNTDTSGSTTRSTTKTSIITRAQLEAGSFPTSYIKNEGTSGGVTRSADVASIPVADFGYNQSAGTLFAVAQNIDGNTTDPRVVVLSDGTADNRIRIDVNDGNNIRMTVSDGGVAQTSTQNTFNDYDSQYKVAFAFKENDFKLLVNNSITLTDSSGTVPDDITTVYIGSNFNGAGGYINGHIKSFKYYPRRLTNAQLEDITS